MPDPKQPVPRFEQRDAFCVLGVEACAWHIDEVDPGFHRLWMTRFMAHVSDYDFDPAKPRFDWMPPDTRGPDSFTAVWIPVVRRF